jgi:hypothetical protein
LYPLLFDLYLLVMIHIPYNTVKSALSRYVPVIEKQANYNSLK